MRGLIIEQQVAIFNIAAGQLFCCRDAIPAEGEPGMTALASAR
jgi:hypothetical protein